MNQQRSEVTVLLIDDDEVDVMTIRRAFRKAKIANPVVVADNGIDGLAKLRSGEVEQPLVILLDVNMPQMTGHEFLAELRADPNLKDLVVFMLTTSNADDDKRAAYDRHVAGYIVKKSAGEDFLDVVQMLDSYWKVVELPKTGS